MIPAPLPSVGAMHRRPVAGSTQPAPPIAEIDVLWITAGSDAMETPSP